MQLTQILTSSLFAAAALGAIISVDVGEGGLVFDPDTITAAVGDQVQFAFYPQNHSVIQSAFDSPCSPMSGGIFSGFVPVSSGQSSQVFAVTIGDTNPIWLYCGQSQHCESGMVAVINPPSGGNNLATFKENAKSAESTVPSGGISGGSFVSPGSGGSSSSSSASSSASSSTGSSTSDSASVSATSSTSSSTSDSASVSATTSTSSSTSEPASSSATTSASSSASENATTTPTASISPFVGAAAAIAVEKAGAIIPILLLVGLLL